MIFARDLLNYYFENMEMIRHDINTHYSNGTSKRRFNMLLLHELETQLALSEKINPYNERMIFIKTSLVDGNRKLLNSWVSGDRRDLEFIENFQSDYNKTYVQYDRLEMGKRYFEEHLKVKNKTECELNYLNYCIAYFEGKIFD